MQRNGVVVLVSVALAAVAIIVSAYMFTHKPGPEPMSDLRQAQEERIACIESGGRWVLGLTPGSGGCEH